MRPAKPSINSAPDAQIAEPVFDRDRKPQPQLYRGRGPLRGCCGGAVTAPEDSDEIR